MNQNNTTLSNFTDVFADENCISQPISLSSKSSENGIEILANNNDGMDGKQNNKIPTKHTGQYGEFRSVEEIEPKYRSIFTYPYFNLVQSRIIEDALYSNKSMVVCAPTGSGKTVVFEMAIAQLLMEFDDKNYTGDFKIIYMAPVKALCTERLTEWYPKFTNLGLLCIEVTGDTDVDFNQLKPYRIIITTPEKWDILTRRWTDYRGLVEVIKLFLIDEVHILNDETRGPVLEAVVSRMKTIEASSQSAYRIEQLQKQYQQDDSTVQSAQTLTVQDPPRIRFVAVSATVSNPEDVAAWLGNGEEKAVYHKFGDECRPVKLKRIVEGYPCAEGTSIFKFDIILNYKLWPIIQKYYDGKPTLIFCNTRKSVQLTAEALSKELTVSFNPEQKAKLNSIASKIKNKKLQMLVANGVGCHHAGLLFEERLAIEQAFRQRDLPILITTTTLAMGVNLPAHLVIVKNTQQYVNGTYQEYSISTVLQMVGRAGRPQFDTEATAVIMTRLQDKPRYQALVGGSEPLQSYLHKRLTENLNSEAALHTVTDVAQCVQWLRSTFLYIRAGKDPRRYLGLPAGAPQQLIAKKIEELCVKAMNGLASSGLITMDDACCIESTHAGKLMSVYYLDFETMKKIMKIEGHENLEQLLWLVCESHELSEMHLRVDERRCLNTLNRNNAAATIRFPMKGKITTKEMKVNCIIQATLGCLPISEPSLNQEATKIMRIADRVCKCLVAYVTRPELISERGKHFSAVLNSIVLAKCIAAHLWENSPYLSKQFRGIGPTFSTLLATAGKVTLLLLEESHPRDLERIMNKGPPAGNVLHKQITLLPKYQLTMTPVDEQTVTIQLLLLNRHYLLENIDNLTAGQNHKSYIVVGDSENHILLLTSFKDKDLIQVYNGVIMQNVTRKHRPEHKILVHCVSSSYVGVDVNCEYLFKDLDPFNAIDHITNSCVDESQTKKVARKQTSIKDTFKERKRKTNVYISQSKEKIRRNNSLIEKFNLLKESFGAISKDIKNELQKKSLNSESGINSNNNIDVERESYISPTDFEFESGEITQDNNTLNEDGDDYVMDDGRVDSILSEIENEISNGHNTHGIEDGVINKNTNDNSYYFNTHLENQEQKPVGNSTLQNDKMYLHKQAKLQPLQRLSFKKPAQKTDNFKFLELLEKNIDLSDSEDYATNCKEHTGFSETVKIHIQQFLNKAQKKVAHHIHAIDEKLLQEPVPNSNQNNDSYIAKDNENFNYSFEDDLNTQNAETCISSKELKIVETETESNEMDIADTGEDRVSNVTNEPISSVSKNEWLPSDKEKKALVSHHNQANHDRFYVMASDSANTFENQTKLCITSSEFESTNADTPCDENFAKDISEDSSNIIPTNTAADNMVLSLWKVDKTDWNSLIPYHNEGRKGDTICFPESKDNDSNVSPICDPELKGSNFLVRHDSQKLPRSSYGTPQMNENKYNRRDFHSNVETNNGCNGEYNSKLIDYEGFKNISYSTTKVDTRIWSKNIESNKVTVKITQKLKLDVDISQQITHDYTRTDSESTSDKNDSQRVSEVSNITEITKELPVDHLIHLADKDQAIGGDSQITVFQKLPGCAKNKFSLSNQIMIPNAIEFEKQPIFQNHTIINSCEESTCTEIITEGKICSLMEEKNTCNENENIAVKNKSQGESPVEMLPNLGHTPVQNLLDKYAKIFREKCVPESIKHTTTNNELKPRAAKPSRPFKIKDIEIIPTEITKQIVEITSTPTPSPKMIEEYEKKVMDNIYAINTKDCNISILAPNKPDSQISPNLINRIKPTSNLETLNENYFNVKSSWQELNEDNVNTIHREDDNITIISPNKPDIPNAHISLPAINKIEETACLENMEEDYFNSDLPSRKVFEETKDFNIDQSMFDPKLLLHCFTKEKHSDEETELIPPPPQFCDETYSPTLNDNHYGSSLDTATNDLLDYNIEHFTCFDIDQATSEDSKTTNEVETWKLSTDDIPERYLYKIDRNPPALGGNVNSYKNIFKRKSNLGQFKYEKNTKVKLRRSQI